MFQSRKNERKKNFSVNGAAVLEQTIRSFNGNCNPIRSYSAEELENATNHFKSDIHSDWNYILYQGIHQNREIAVKKLFRPNFETNAYLVELAVNEIAIASRMSSHDSVLKLLGCCLETELPILVYEFPENGNLGNNRLFDRQSQDRLSWDQKLKIVIKIANSIAYLHHGLPNTFIHRDVKPKNIFLDRNLCPKLFDFQFAVQIPEGETHVEVDVRAGTRGYSDPVADSSGYYTEKSDVYGFGALLCDVLTEEWIFHLRNRHRETLDISSNPRFGFDDFVRKTVEERYCKDEKMRAQVVEYVKLMRRCIESNPWDRPDNMIEVEKELRRIKSL